jgi:hypothetical protein
MVSAVIILSEFQKRTTPSLPGRRDLRPKHYQSAQKKSGLQALIGMPYSVYEARPTFAAAKGGGVVWQQVRLRKQKKSIPKLAPVNLQVRALSPCCESHASRLRNKISHLPFDREPAKKHNKPAWPTSRHDREATRCTLCPRIRLHLAHCTEP